MFSFGKHFQKMMKTSFVYPLTKEHKMVVDSLLTQCPDLHLIQGYHNSDFTEIENDIPSGMVMIHPPSSKVHPDNIPLNAFSYMVVCPIASNTDKITDASFKGFEDAIQEAVPQYCANPPNLDVRGLSGLDSKHWEAEFGEDEHSFAGVFKRTTKRDTKYYVCAQAGAPVACKQLKEKLAKQPLTYEQLLHDPDYNYCHYLAQRNAQRLAYNVARACKVSIRHMQDTGAYSEYDYSGKPMRAVPQFIQANSTVASVTYKSEAAVGVFNKVTPVSQGVLTQFVYEGPYHGISVFNMNGKAKGYGLPAHSGKIENPPKADQAVQKRCQGILCESGIAEQHPDITHDSFRSTDDEHFLQHMNQLGWKTEGINNLVPVLVKIWDPSIKRQ